MIEKLESNSHDITLTITPKDFKPYTVSIIPRDNGTLLLHFSGLGSNCVIPNRAAANQIEIKISQS